MKPRKIEPREPRGKPLQRLKPIPGLFVSRARQDRLALAEAYRAERGLKTPTRDEVAEKLGLPIRKPEASP